MQPRPTGLKPTLRLMMIVVLWAALLAAVGRSFVSNVIGTDLSNICVVVPILLSLLSLPLLAVLIGMFGTRGPVGDWYRAMCVAVACLFGGMLFLLQDPVCYVLSSRLTPMFPISTIIGLIFVWSGYKQLRPAWPGRCPNCDRRALIPIAAPGQPASQLKAILAKDGWCATCGPSYHRQGRSWTPSSADDPTSIEPDLEDL